MKLNELMKSVLSWAANRKTPFTTAEAYESMKGVDDIKQLSDTLRNLYMGGHLARQKLDGFRYAYALASAGLEGFEIAQPAEDEPAASGEAPSQPRQKAVRPAKAAPVPLQVAMPAAVEATAAPVPMPATEIVLPGRPADTALAKPSGAGVGAKARSPQAGDCIANESARLTITLQVAGVIITIKTEGQACA